MCEKVSICFTGDIAFTHYFKDISPDKQLFSDRVSAFLSDADYCVANVEGPIIDSAMLQGSRFVHYSNRKQAERIRNMKIWNLANRQKLVWIKLQNFSRRKNNGYNAGFKTYTLLRRG